MNPATILRRLSDAVTVGALILVVAWMGPWLPAIIHDALR